MSSPTSWWPKPMDQSEDSSLLGWGGKVTVKLEWNVVYLDLQFIYQTTNGEKHTLTHSTSQSLRYGKEATCWRSLIPRVAPLLSLLRFSDRQYWRPFLSEILYSRTRQKTIQNQSFNQFVLPHLTKGIAIYFYKFETDYTRWAREPVQTRILHWGDHWDNHYIGITESLTVCFATVVPMDTRKCIENLIN